MPKRILLIEDEEDARELVRQELEELGHQIVMANDGEEGLKLVKNYVYDLIILDIQTPYMDGYTFIKKLNADTETKNIPIIILTGKSKLAPIFEAEGVKEFLVKPVNGNVLIAAVHKYIN